LHFNKHLPLAEVPKSDGTAAFSITQAGGAQSNIDGNNPAGGGFLWILAVAGGASILLLLLLILILKKKPRKLEPVKLRAETEKIVNYGPKKAEGYGIGQYMLDNDIHQNKTFIVNSKKNNNE